MGGVKHRNKPHLPVVEPGLWFKNQPTDVGRLSTFACGGRVLVLVVMVMLGGGVKFIGRQVAFLSERVKQKVLVTFRTTSQQCT